jgi:hypothetical protein
MSEKPTHYTSIPLQEKPRNSEAFKTPTMIRTELIDSADGVKSDTLSVLLALDDEHLVLFDADFFNFYTEPYGTLQFGAAYDTKGASALIREYAAIPVSDTAGRKRLAQEIRKIIK